MRLFNYLTLFIISGYLSLFLSLHASAYAQTVDQYVSAGERASWIELQSVPDSETSLNVEGGEFYRLVDYQRRISKTRNDRYRHFALELKTSDAVQDNSNFSVSFHPSYQNVKIHALNLIRKGERLNRLDLSQFDIYRLETDREKLLYDGRLQTALIIPDVRVGDILEYSYTISGRNPELIPGYVSSATLNYGVPVQRQHERVLVHNDLPVFKKSHNSARDPEVTNWGQYKVHTWLANDIEKLDVDEDIPNWQYARPVYTLSAYKDWSDAGEFFAPKYTPRYKQNGPIPSIATSIKNETSDLKKQARMALDYVQTNIRYTGIDIGSGGYEPRDPELVLEQKFGDCKDMTILLLAILRELDISSHAMLVDSDMRGGIDRLIPSHGAFDHVLVRAEIEGLFYNLDGTRGEQLGDLNNMAQSHYGKGLLLQPGNARLIDINIRKPEYYKDITDTFDIVSDPEIITFKSVSVYHNYEADAMNSTFINNGKGKLEENFLNFFQNTYPTIKQVGDMEIEIDEAKATLTVTVNYEIPKAWETDLELSLKTFPAYPSDVTSDVPDFKAGERTMPLALSYPRKSRHKLVFLADETWAFEDSRFEEDNEAFKFSKISTFQKGIYTETYFYESKQDYISAENFKSYMTRISAISDELGVTIQQGTGWLSNVSDDAITGGIILWIALAAILSLIGVLIKETRSEGEELEQVFYPIKLSKFILLSIISIGYYQIFWAYKNWKWLRDVGNEPNMPLVRSFFMVFTNFSLLPQFSREDDIGYRWYNPYLGGFLALIYFILEIMGRIGDRIETAPFWLTVLGLLSGVALIPAAAQILRLNANHPEAVAENSVYNWMTFGFIFLFAPVLILVLIGVFAS